MSAFGEDVWSSGRDTAAGTCSLPPYASSALPLAAFCSQISAIVSDQRPIANIADHAWLVVSGRRPTDSLRQTRSLTLTCWLVNIEWIKQHSIFVPPKHRVTTDDTDLNSCARKVLWIMRWWRQTADTTSSRPWQGRNDVTLCVITNSDNEYLHWHVLCTRQLVLLGSVQPLTKPLSTNGLTNMQ